MRLLSRLLNWALRTLAALTLLLALFLIERLSWLPRSLSPQSGTIAVHGIADEVKIVRDRNDIPHISGAGANDIFFGLGFAHAQDRLWQMAFTRRLLQGRLSELVGAPALSIDTYFRALDLDGRGAASLDHVSAETRAALSSYADGVNAWAQSRRAHLPPEFHLLMTDFEPWQPRDSMLILKYFALNLSENASQEILRVRLEKLLGAAASELFPAYPDSAPITLRDAVLDQHADAALMSPFLASLGDLRGASNSWVVDGRLTKSGLPLLANDPHLGLSAPGVWYLAHLALPTGDVVGATTPGVPAIVLGHNGHIAWGFTTTGGDTEDVVIETLSPEDKNRYLAPHGSAPFDIKTVKIKRRFAPSVEVTLRETRHGPVLPETPLAIKDALEPGTVFALAATALSRTDTTMDAAFGMMRARTIGDLHAAMETFLAPQQNMVYADTSGNIGFIAPGLVPIRGQTAVADGLEPADGKTQNDLWPAYVPYKELPQVLNPSSGRIWTANNKIVPDTYPYFIAATWSDGWRARRIGELLSKGAPYDAQSFTRIQLDDFASDARALINHLVAPSHKSDRPNEASQLLAHWDFRMRADRPEPLVYMAVLRALQKRLVADELGDLAPQFARPNPQFLLDVLGNRNGMAKWCDDKRTEHIEACDEMIDLSLGDAVNELSKVYGSDPHRWRWGQAHVARFDHLALGSIPVLGDFFDRQIETGGGPNSVDRGDMTFSGDHPYASVHAASLRAVYDLSDLSRARFMMPMGQSGNPLSPNYDNFNRAWAQGETFTIPLDEALYKKEALGTWTLRPKP